MPIRINSHKGYVRKPIKDYKDAIVNNLIPALENSIETLSINTNPIRFVTTIIEFAGILEDRRIIIEFSSNDIRLDEASDSSLFSSVYYNNAKEDAGIIDLNNIQDCVEMIIGALYDLGWKSSEDKAKQKAEQEAKEKEELEKKKAAEQKRKEELYNNDSEEFDEPEEQIDYTEKDKQSISEFSSLFDKYLKAMSDRNQMGSIMFVNISTDIGKTYKMLNITLTYISSTMCLIETDGINPQLNKTVSWEQAKNYCIKVTEKVDGAISVEAVDEQKRDLEIPEDNDDLNLDINI